MIKFDQMCFPRFSVTNKTDTTSKGFVEKRIFIKNRMVWRSKLKFFSKLAENDGPQYSTGKEPHSRFLWSNKRNSLVRLPKCIFVDTDITWSLGGVKIPHFFFLCRPQITSFKANYFFSWRLPHTTHNNVNFSLIKGFTS